MDASVRCARRVKACCKSGRVQHDDRRDPGQADSSVRSRRCRPRRCTGPRSAILDTVGRHARRASEPCARIVAGVTVAPARACCSAPAAARRARRRADQRHRLARAGLRRCAATRWAGIRRRRSCRRSSRSPRRRDDRRRDSRRLCRRLRDRDAASPRGVNFHHYEKGWHPTATLGVFGAAAACCHLLGSDAGGDRDGAGARAPRSQPASRPISAP